MGMNLLMKEAKSGEIREEIKEISEKEGVPLEFLLKKISQGKVIVPRNLERREEVKLVGIGEGLTTKVNVNVGTSTLQTDLEMELEKARIAVEYGTDTMMDLSTGGDLDEIRRKLMEFPVPFGTVPVYQAFLEAIKKRGAGVEMTEDDLFKVIEKHFKDGVDFVTVHSGVTKETIEKAMARNERRVAGIVSRGGAIISAWMLHNEEENPLNKNYDYLLELASEYDVVLSLGDALRPGSVLDSSDYLQMAEMLEISRLVERAWEKGVQVMVEGPGHVPLDQVAPNVKLEKSLCKGAPYYLLGPLVTDIAAGYDHISSAIGAAIASAEGADLICYLTPAEHLSLPTPEEVKEGLIASKIAAHAGDIVKLGKRALKKDREISEARRNLDWKRIYSLCLDPKKAKKIRERFFTGEGPCTMCGELCVYLILKDL